MITTTRQSEILWIVEECERNQDIDRIEKEISDKKVYLDIIENSIRKRKGDIESLCFESVDIISAISVLERCRRRIYHSLQSCG